MFFSNLYVGNNWKCLKKHLGGGFKYFYFHPYLGKWSILTNIFQMGWNHQLEHPSKNWLASEFPCNDKFTTVSPKSHPKSRIKRWAFSDEIRWKTAPKQVPKHLWELNDSFPFEITSFVYGSSWWTRCSFSERLVASNTCGWKFCWENPKTAKYPSFHGNLTP